MQFSEKTLKGIVRKIERGYSPEKIILFGSYAYGKPSSISDIDLFIIKDTKEKPVDRFCRVRKLIRNVKEISVQPIVFTKKELAERLDIEDDFIAEILAKGKVLYER